MIRELTSLDGWEDFIEELNRDSAFSDPMISTPWLLENNLLNAVGKPDDHVPGVYRDGERIGLFDFLIPEAEKYAEMIVGWRRRPAA